jgi:hypothetical protein
MKSIFIPGNVASSKNSKQWTGKYLVDSKTTQRYRTSSAWYWKLNKREFQKMLEGKDKPYIVKFFFVRDSRRKFDFVNMVQICQDLMVEYGWIADDNCNEMLPFPVIHNLDPLYETKWYAVDKDKPGVYISVL